MKIKAAVECPVFDSFRVNQVCGMFDLAPAKKAREVFEAEVPGVEEDWSVGLIVGPSGSGKSTVAREAFGDSIYAGGDWPSDRAVVDCFGEEASIRDVTQVLSSVGFSSPPGWVKPYGVLSNGEKFRCDLARALSSPAAENGAVVVFDEFTSVVDRTVAKIGSAAVAKAIRAGRIRKKFVAVACHYDIAEWLEPDWVLDMASRTLARGSLRRPPITLKIVRTDSTAWDLFRRHHYLDTSLHKSAKCFVGLVDGSPAAFVGVIHFPHPTASGWREHRCVCLPDFQGVGIGNRMSEFVAGVMRATGKPYTSTTSHPAMMRYRAKSPVWRMIRKPGRVTGTTEKSSTGQGATVATNRITASFEFIGPARIEEARRFGVTGSPAA